MVIPFIVISSSKMLFQILYNSLLKTSLFVLVKGSVLLFPSMCLSQEKCLASYAELHFLSWEKGILIISKWSVGFQFMQLNVWLNLGH